MAKEVKAKIKMRIPGGGATPAPPVGSALGPFGIKTMDFCKQFNAQTSNKKGETVPVEVTIYKDRSFSFVTKTPPTSELILKKIKLKKGSPDPKEKKVGKISWKEVEEIAQIKMPDLNATDIEQAKKIVAGSARSMGVEVVD
ncbi:50S ribosomal protein L11 [Candidatus Dependentiae bacterium]|nr:50S ribosomal protein L11 [Candidatus Dependentiae bacterium]